MIKKVLCSLSLVGISALAAQAQTVLPCGTDEVYHRLVSEHPEIATRNAALNEEIANKLAKMTEKDLLPFAKKTDDGTVAYDIPIVFHVIHDYGAEYVTDDAIRACVARMNKLYNKQNADTIEVIAPFRGFINNSTTRYIGNARITWHLATKDPNGNPTTGITRRRSYLTNRAGDLAKYDQWPPNNYMNVWLINAMSEQHSSAAAYAYKPATADVIPYYDGPIMVRTYLNEEDYTLSHELGHELNLDHTWGGTNNPEVACGDDDVDDTPPTKGHSPNPSCPPSDIYDTECLLLKREIGKAKLDTLVVGSLLGMKADTSTSYGITFKSRTAGSIDSFVFYPSAAIGSTYRIGLKRNNVIIDSFDVVSTVINDIQKVKRRIPVPATDTATNYKLFFMQNPGAWRDSINSSPYSRGVNGAIWMKTADNIYTNDYYNFFYDWNTTYGYYKVYAPDSLVDYPDTTNSQNVMDYTYCSKMFTTGQVMRMRAALTSTTAKRSSLITPENLALTGALDPMPAIAPKAEFSVERGITAGGASANSLSYFMCADNASLVHNFKFTDRTWRAAATSSAWILSNGATNTTPVVTSGVTNLITRFTNPGWATVQLVAENTNGKDTFVASPGVYIADPNAINPLGYWQDFDLAEQNDKWPMFNYYNNRYKWEFTEVGTYDNKGIRYRSFDNRSFPDNLVGEAQGDYDDIFTPAFDLSVLGPDNGNLNFSYAMAYATNNSTLMKDTLEIAYSNSCGANWTTLKKIGGTDLQTAGSLVGVEYNNPSWDDWKPVSIDLKNGTTLIRDNKVFFRFRYRPSSRPVGSFAYASGNNFYLDRFFISNNKLSVNKVVLGDKTVALSPNPATQSTFVLFQKANNNVKIQVLDMTGKVVYSVDTKIDQNNAKVEIPVGQLGAKGIYMVRITGDDNLNQTEKLVVY